MRSCPKRALRLVQRLLTGKTQLERLLQPESLTNDLTEFRSYLTESDELREDIGIFVVSDFPMDLDKIMNILEQKKTEIAGNLGLLEIARLKLQILNQPNSARQVTDHLAGTPVTSHKHNTLLKQLWKCMGDGSEIPTWKSLGFQNDKFPYTDFRGEGVLGLYCLLHLGLSDSEKARSLISRTSELQFAILSINVTRWTRTWLHDRKTTPLDHFFYDCRDSRADILRTFAAIHWSIFDIFVDFWETAGETRSVEFPMRSEEFKIKLIPVLRQLQIDQTQRGVDFPEYLSL